MGAGYDFDYDIGFSWLFRFNYRHYLNQTALQEPAINRDDFRYILTLELSKGITEHWIVSVSGAFTWADSNGKFYDYSRHIVGTYVTYRF